MEAEDGTAPQPGGKTVTKRVRRGLGGWWVLALILVPILVAALATLTRHNGIQNDLKHRTQSALSAGGVDGAKVSFSGRDATITVAPGPNSKKAKTIAKRVTGVRTVEVKTSGTAAPTPNPSPTSAAGTASATCTDLTAKIGTLLKGNEPSFGDNSTALQPSSDGTLSKVASLLKGCPNVMAQVAGYTDNTGTADGNKQVSQARADAVRDYLVKQGVTSGKLTSIGYGEADPIASNDTDAGRQQNRRVEITVQGG
ncbi:OmpA family protein [Leekyejoonella antrihumi]|uniref:OmpA family protein n=1 Tax=Leekyejoonella antrihumi TaxID=1660198 RepID=A0A563E6K7_9MICO|nr:OmpA family protein [Leekyejoonella antrihumi]TWP37893.1 OmpA family protein [Leekyejoonella antrihumi]